MNDKQQLAAMGEHMAEQAGQEPPLCMAKRIEELEAQVRVMVGLLREATSWMDDHPAMPDSSAMHAALAGNLPSHVPECWQPIETAPKDGKMALLLARFSAAGNLAELDWDGEWGSYRDGPNDDLHWDWLSYGGIDNPTHWFYQPLAAAKNPEAK